MDCRSMHRVGKGSERKGRPLPGQTLLLAVDILQATDNKTKGWDLLVGIVTPVSGDFAFPITETLIVR